MNNLAENNRKTSKLLENDSAGHNNYQMAGKWHSKLAPYTKQIFQMRKELYTLHEICDWLEKEKGTKCRVSTLHSFIKNRTSGKSPPAGFGWERPTQSDSSQLPPDDPIERAKQSKPKSEESDWPIIDNSQPSKRIKQEND